MALLPFIKHKTPVQRPQWETDWDEDWKTFILITPYHFFILWEKIGIHTKVT